MIKRKKLRLILSVIILGFFIISPSFADEQIIELSPDVPYVDVVVEATEPTQITIQTTTGTPQTNLGFIDSWIELWQDVTKLRADDDGAHSGTNVLASFITTPIDAGIYFIRATSFAWMASNQTQFPTGNYVLTWNGVTTVQPTPTPIPEPTPTETVNLTPTPTPTESESPTPEQSATNSFTPTPIPELTQEQQPQTNTNNQQNEPILIQETPTPTPLPIQQETTMTELEIIEEIVEEQTIEIPIIEEQFTEEQIQEQIDQQYIEQNTLELSVPTALEDIPGVQQIFAATEAILNVGSNMTQEQREESQSVVVAAIVVSQIASMASVTASAQNKRFKK